MLTAAHVVCPDSPPPTEIKIRTEVGLVNAEVAWHRHSDDVDVALLRITDPDWEAPVRRHPVRWGRLVTSRAGQRCEAIGFPAVVAEPRRRDSHHASGVVNPGNLVKAGLYGVEVDNPPATPGIAGSKWAGMSGAAVLCDGRVIGVVTQDAGGFDSRRLVIVPITTVSGDPGFRELVAQACDRVPTLEPVELIGLAEPVRPVDSPAGLLRADVAETPFRARPELDELLGWCEQDEWSSIRLVIGPGGQGKTRLACQLADRLTEQEWAVVKLAELATADQISALARVVVPTLVVVDYAEGRLHQLEAILAAFGQAEAKVRLLLLARTAGAWRTEYVAPSPLLEVLADERIVVRLSPLEPDVEGRRDAWRQALGTFARGLGELNGERCPDIDWTAIAEQMAVPVLDEAGFRTILAVQMDALAWLLQAGDPISEVDERRPEEVLLAHERRYWDRVASRFGVTVTPSMRQSLVATATLWGAADAEQARQLLSATLPGYAPDALATIDDWLAALYQDGQRHWSGLQPDKLAEYLIGTVLGPTGRCPGLLEGAARVVTAEQCEHAFTVLGRAIVQHAHLELAIAEIIRTSGEPAGVAALRIAPRLEQPQRVIEALQPLIATSGLRTLAALAGVLPERSMLLADVSLTITQALVAELRDADADRASLLSDLGRAVNNLGARFGAVGRFAEGLAASEEAVELRRQLVELDRDANLADLAGSVNNVAVQLEVVGRIAEALSAGQEAVHLYRELADRDRAAHLPSLAMSLQNLSMGHAAASHSTEALNAAKEAVDLRRELVELNRDSYLPGLADAVDNLAVRLHEASHRDDALSTVDEAVGLYRELVGLNRDPYLRDLADSLRNLGIWLGEAGRPEESMAIADEVVELRRELVKFNRSAHRSALASAVHNRAARLTEAGQSAAALDAAQEAVQLYRELAEGDRSVHLRNLAAAAHNLARVLGDVSRYAEGVTLAEESVELWRELVTEDREAHLKGLAMTLATLVAQLNAVDRRDEALAAAGEAVRLCRELVVLKRGANLNYLGRSLHNLAILLGEAGRNTEGVTVAQEAVEVRRELVGANREAHLPAFVSTVLLLAVRLDAVNSPDAALTATEEAEGLYRELAELDNLYLPDLAQTVHSLAQRLVKAGRRAQALVTAREASQRYRDAEQVHPGHYEEFLRQANRLVIDLESDAS